MYKTLAITVVILGMAGLSQAALLAVDCEPGTNYGTQPGFDSMVCDLGTVPIVFATSGGQTVTITPSTDAGTATLSASNKGSKDPGNGFPRNLAMYDMVRNNASNWGNVNADIPVLELDIAGLQPETEYPLLIGSLSVYRELFQIVRPMRGTTGPTLVSADAPFPQVLGDCEVEGLYTTDAAGVLSVDVVFDQAAAQAFVAGGGISVDTQAVISYIMIPEPATLSLLALGALAAIRRRR